jgi:Flp pilus assembly protein TadG
MLAQGRSSPPQRETERGQALAETAIVIVVLVLLVMGIIEFGRAWMVINMITHAARDGARTAAVLAQSSRGTCGSITSDYGPIAGPVGTGLVLSEINNVMPPTDLTVTISQSPPVASATPCPTPASLPMVTVTVNGTVPYIFNLVGTNFSVNRSVTFLDEGR